MEELRGDVMFYWTLGMWKGKKSKQEVTGKTEENGKDQQEVLKGFYGPQKWLLKESHVPQSGAKACGGWCQTALGLCYVTLVTSSSWNVLSL